MPMQLIRDDILYVTFQLLSPKEMMATLDEVLEKVKSSEAKLNILADLRGVPVGRPYLEYATEKGQEIKEYTSKSAILGISGLKQLSYEHYEKFSNHVMTIFDDYDEAITYLKS